MSNPQDPGSFNSLQSSVAADRSGRVSRKSVNRGQVQKPWCSPRTGFSDTGRHPAVRSGHSSEEQVRAELLSILSEPFKSGCTLCDGSGVKDGKSCLKCKGSGVISIRLV